MCYVAFDLIKIIGKMASSYDMIGWEALSTIGLPIGYTKGLA